MHNKDYEYHSNISKISKVQFSLLSPDEIKNQSACKIQIIHYILRVQMAFQHHRQEDYMI
jgi:hypothetical protein